MTATQDFGTGTPGGPFGGGQLGAAQLVSKPIERQSLESLQFRASLFAADASSR